ncbi:CYTH and CHAD domain-containing protein [Streptomyces sp. IB2014 016-6]|uniref:CYTH and CHAD domain-containing protein n=1 Tax=Streptomyces sp. IB2014 016-6 TaxID=2517818 RepID=UPI0011C9B7DA|nr:CYTH and CHAD domain-containing protein [Streptomyces sp. IB2014 016-6]TXL88988.1 CYTH and CHAD domain-containing protein [Streptomyces sp. IB2014 016-6]
MADTKREIERKYELPVRPEGGDGGSPLAGPSLLPDLTKVRAVSAVTARGVTELDAVYHDTPDLRLTAGSLTLRRRTGGADEGWHLKFPVGDGVRDEIRAPLSDTLPGELAALVRSRVRGAELTPVVRLRTSRDTSLLVDEAGRTLAEVAVDTVRAERRSGSGAGTGTGTAEWTEIEVELADDGDPALLDAVEKVLRKAGVRPASASSKLARALAETAPAAEGAGPGKRAKTDPRRAPATAGDHVLAYVREQADAIVSYDPAVRRDLPDSVHQLRVATRRMRSAFRTYKKVLDRDATRPIGAELKWLAGELGVDRDQEVLAERLTAGVEAHDTTLLLGPVHARLRIWDAAGRTDARDRTLTVLDSARYLRLLDSVAALLADPPLLDGAGRKPAKVLPRAVVKDYERLAGRVEHALRLAPGEERDLALHDARKAAKRARYAADAAEPALGKSAKRFSKRMKAVQSVLGDHQDSVVARDALRDLAVQAHAAGESAFTWGLLYGEEESRAADRERELPRIWRKSAKRKLRTALFD